MKLDLNNKTILITGAAGFIGSNLTLRLLKELSGVSIIGIDNMNDYYDVSIKEYRLSLIEKEVANNNCNSFVFSKGDIANREYLNKVFEEYKPQIVVNLAAQAGVRYSITNPDAYIESNIIGFYNIIECAKTYTVQHLVYASSSSVYGNSTKIPYSTEDRADSPVSLYAATKRSNELIAHSYSKLYNIPVTGLRFFTVYGPAGRPDMAYFGFTDKLCAGEKIKIFNFGNCKRDFTYIDDITQGIVKVMQSPLDKMMGEDGLPIPPCNLYNIGNSDPVNLMDFVKILSEELIDAEILPKEFDIEKHMELVPMQPGDVPVTFADVSALEQDFGYKPSTKLRDGLKEFAKWYKDFYFKD